MVPTGVLSEGGERICASNLKLHHGGKQQQQQKGRYHFAKKPLQAESETLAKNVTSTIVEVVQTLSTHIKRSLYPAVLQCAAATVCKLNVLQKSISTEADLRYAVGDPILEMLCKFWNLQVSVIICAGLLWSQQLPALCPR